MMLICIGSDSGWLDVTDLVPEEVIRELHARLTPFRDAYNQQWALERRRAEEMRTAQREEDRKAGRLPLTPYERRVALRTLAERDGPGCRACGSTDRLSVDHVIPRAKGGTSALENLQLLCRTCNGSKGTKTMAEWIGARP